MGGCEGTLSGVPEPAVKYHSDPVLLLTLASSSEQGTAAGREFDWGGRLPKRNGGAQRSPQRGRQPRPEECKGTRGLDCEADVPSRWETRA